MFKALSVFTLFANVAAFLFAVAFMVENDGVYPFVFSMLAFMSLPVSVWFVANSLSK